MVINKTTLFSSSLMIIGATMILLGARWMLVDEPWMLDEAANVERLEMEFDELFKSEVNKTLPSYLKQIYRFFGFWVIIIGLFVTSFSTPGLIRNKDIRLRLLSCIGAMILVGIILGYSLIPSSPFIYLIWIMVFIYGLAQYAHVRMKNDK